MGLQERVDAIPYWYHKIELPGGIVTDGWAPLHAEQYRIPDDLTGKRVLDVGAWDGYWTFEALKRGAAQVIAIDDFSDMLDTNGAVTRKEWDTFDLCVEALDIPHARCKRYTMSVYEAAKLGRFDVVFFFGTLYHLRHPLLALDTLQAICKESLHVETAICDDYSPYRGGIGCGFGNEMVMEFYPNKEYGDNPTNWWAPSLRTLTYMIQASGWQGVKTWKLCKEPGAAPSCRGFAETTRNPGEIWDLETSEGNDE